MPWPLFAARTWHPCRIHTGPQSHYNGVIMDTMASQITILAIVYSTVYSGADQRNHQSSALLAFCAGNSPVTGEFPAQMASNVENVFIWWHHHVLQERFSATCPISLSRNGRKWKMPVNLLCFLKWIHDLKAGKYVAMQQIWFANWQLFNQITATFDDRHNI